MAITAALSHFIHLPSMPGLGFALGGKLSDPSTLHMALLVSKGRTSWKEFRASIRTLPLHTKISSSLRHWLSSSRLAHFPLLRLCQSISCRRSSVACVRAIDSRSTQDGSPGCVEITRVSQAPSAPSTPASRFPPRLSLLRTADVLLSDFRLSVLFPPSVFSCLFSFFLLWWWRFPFQGFHYFLWLGWHRIENHRFFFPRAKWEVCQRWQRKLTAGYAAKHQAQPVHACLSQRPLKPTQKGLRQSSDSLIPAECS